MNTNRFIQGTSIHPPDPKTFLLQMPVNTDGSSSGSDESILSRLLVGRPIPAPYQYVGNNGHSFRTDKALKYIHHSCHDPYLKCPQQVWHMLRTYADFHVNHCGSWRMSTDVRYKSADVRASVKACGLLRTFFRISWGYLFADVRSSMQVSLRTSAKACVKF